MKKLLIIGSLFIICAAFQKKKTAPIPACINKKIAAWKKLSPDQQPQSITEYVYKGKKVYYVVLPCCDQFNELYDASCKLLGRPDGGFTGRGDGTLPDFNSTKSHPRLIWKQPAPKTN
ncbi:MAG: hypothetical protein JST86_10065 [Bacteroidetes bacterium]|nr:hypothetical protein [Bacteroidota bacterium]